MKKRDASRTQKGLPPHLPIQKEMVGKAGTKAKEGKVRGEVDEARAVKGERAEARPQASAKAKLIHQLVALKAPAGSIGKLRL